MMAYWEHRHRAAMQCPVCRARISLLMTSPAFMDATMRGSIAEFNRRFSGQPRSVRGVAFCGRADALQVLEHIRDVPALLRRLWMEVRQGNVATLLGGSVLLHTLLTLLMAVVYTLMPFDIVPEAVFGIIGSGAMMASACMTAAGLWTTWWCGSRCCCWSAPPPAARWPGSSDRDLF